MLIKRPNDNAAEPPLSDTPVPRYSRAIDLCERAQWEDDGLPVAMLAPGHALDKGVVRLLVGWVALSSRAALSLLIG